MQLSLLEALKAASLVQGFELSGGVDIAPVLDSPESQYLKYFESYRHWIAQNLHGPMSYLERGMDKRMDPRRVFAPAKSIFCVGRLYPASPVGSDIRYARYLRGEDYHHTMARDLEHVVQAAMVTLNTYFTHKICVDTSAVQERTWAALAGLGWIGKNGMLIHPQFGSYFLLAEVLLSVPLDAAADPLPDRCGKCDRCIRGCPTSAIKSPGILDSKECISAWTLECRDEPSSPQWQSTGTKGFVAGCDLCQEVCPFNNPRARSEHDPGPDPTLILDPEQLLSESTEVYKARVKNSALSRCKPEQFARNLKSALRGRSYLKKG